MEYQHSSITIRKDGKLTRPSSKFTYPVNSNGLCYHPYCGQKIYVRELRSKLRDKEKKVVLREIIDVFF